MKAIILCGGRGRRMESDFLQLPKSLVSVGNRPLILYVMERYVAAGISEFVLCGGYRVKQLQAYFGRIGNVVEQSHKYVRSSFTISGIACTAEIWDTGSDTCKADRIRMVLDRVADDIFFISYCDCISDVDINGLLVQHNKTGALMTLTVVNPTSRYGHVICEENMALAIEEKPVLYDVWINGGFIAASPEVTNWFQSDGTGDDLESTIMPKLASHNRMAVYRHTGFWRNVETQKDIQEMNELLLEQKR